MRSLQAALDELLAGCQSVGEVEQLPLIDCLGRLLAQPVVSPVDVPAFDNSQMDGYAVRVAEVHAEQPIRVSQRIAAGDAAQPLQPSTVARIFTGAPLPEGADAVVMQEWASPAGEDQVVFSQRPRVGDNIRPRAGDLAVGEALFGVGHRLSAADLAWLASVGQASLAVYRPLRVGVFSSGNELVQPGQPLGPGQIYDSNRPMVLALVRGLGAQATDLGCLPDRLDVTREALARAAQDHDLLLTCGGVSVGEEDHLKAAVMAEGSLDLWKIAIKPGKPFASGRVGRAHFLGMPGNPVSAWVTFMLLVRPYLLKAMGMAQPLPTWAWAEAAFDWPKPDARQEFLRGHLNASGSLEIHGRQNSQVLSSICQSSLLVEIPAQTPVKRGDRLRYIGFDALR